MRMDDLKALEILALKSRERPDFESELRKIQRWYSKSFSTPLKEVETLDIHYLLQHKYEDFINNLPEEDYIKYKNQLLWPERLEQIAADDEDWVAKALQAEEEKLKKSQETSLNLDKEDEFDVEF